MRILFLSEDYYPRVSGIPVVVKYLAEGLFKIGHDVCVATSLKGNKIREETLNGVRIVRFDIYENLIKMPVGETMQYKSFVMSYAPDVMIVEYTQCVTTDLILPILHQMGWKKIFHSHGFAGLDIKYPFKICDGFLHTIGHTYNWLRSQFYFKYWLKKYFSYFDAGLILSEVDSGKPFMTKVLDKKCFVLGNAADDVFFQDDISQKNPLNKIVKLKASRYCFSCANYLVVKNQKELIKEFFKINDDNLALVCIGRTDTPYYYECKRLVEKLEKIYGKREVYLLYNVDRAMIPGILQNAFLYLSSSTYEQYSISIVEAMAKGIPFISTNVGNARVLPGGLTIDSISDLHNAIDELVMDYQRYQYYSVSGKKFASDECRVNVAVNKLNDIINSL